MPKTSLILIVALMLTSVDRAKAQRPRVHLSVATGSESVACGGCNGRLNQGVAIVNLEAGASRQSAFLTGRLSAWSSLDLVEQGDHSTFFAGAVGGYQVNAPIAVYAGLGRHIENHTGVGTSSSGFAALAGVELVFGGIGLGGRVHAELLQSINGKRTTEFEGEEISTFYKPRLIQVGIGVIWR